MRLSFTGEAALELHHPIDRSVELWRALLELGADMGIRPHGLKALFGLRLEKGHVIVGMDSEMDSTPRRLRMDWAVRMDKPFFNGKAALARTMPLPDHRRLSGFTMPGPAPTEGSPISVAGEIVGHVTGSWASPLLGHTAAARLAQADAVPGPGRDRRPRGRRRADPVLRPGGPPCARLSRCPACGSWPPRRPSTSAALGPAATSRSCASRPDDAFAIGARRVELDDPDAIVEPEPGFVGAWLTADELSTWSRRASSGRSRRSGRPSPRGTIAGVPAKLWLPGRDRARALLARRPRRVRRRAGGRLR